MRVFRDPVRAGWKRGAALAGAVEVVSTKTWPGDFPGGPVAKTLSSQCKGPGFHPWLKT